MTVPANVIDAFWKKVLKGDGCWLWAGAPAKVGYGRLRVDGVLYYAHRLALEISGVLIPPGHCACHHCDNRMCVRPDHLFVGTHTDNHGDMVAKGRNALPPKMAGASHPRCRHSDDIVRRARTMASQSTIRGTARALGLSQRTVQRWVRGTSRTTS